jgi:F plasmid transfer operon, TraF, protein
MLRTILIFCFTSLFFSISSQAANAPDYTIHQEYTSTRALGMGNAFTAVVDDHSAMFYNPAALAVRTDTQLRLFLRAGIEPEILSLTDDIDAAGDDEIAMNAALEKHYGEHLYLRTTLGGMLVRPKWGLAILPVDLSLDLALHQSVAASVFVNAYVDSTVAFSRAKMVKVPKLKNKLAVGWTAKVINRAFYSDIIQSSQLATDDSDLVNIDRAAEGATLDLDIGVLYESKRGEGKWYQPTIGIVVKNILDYGFTTNFGLVSDDDSREPPKLQRRLDIGTKFDLPDFWVFDPKMAIDVKDIGHDNWTWLKGFHAGAEMYWKMTNWWKGHWSVGLNQGYWTAGFGARLGIFQLDLASWGEEVGSSDHRQESRRYILEGSLDF